MNLNISGHHLDVTPAIRAHITEKMNRIKRHFDHVIDASVVVSVEKLIQRAEATIHVRGKDIHVTAEDENLYAAIDFLADKLDRQVLKHKNKVQNRSHDAIKRQETIEVPGVET
ncbi:MAG: ribosome hibernation-promoting factor, HPF/YfiA family [Burkholderiaceae bacterium]|jgi:putative sigma-54 modulation protein